MRTVPSSSTVTPVRAAVDRVAGHRRLVALPDLSVLYAVLGPCASVSSSMSVGSRWHRCTTAGSRISSSEEEQVALASGSASSSSVVISM